MDAAKVLAVTLLAFKQVKEEVLGLQFVTEVMVGLA
jgi:hypothetical protein